MSDVQAQLAGNAKKVFVISPIGSKGSPERILADRFLNFVVKRALPAPEYKVERADEDDSAWAITEAMLRAIVEADICVADITGRNPNVMYELALAHAMDKRVIIMNSDDKPAPFDIKDQRALSYGIMPEEIDEAVIQLRQKATHQVGPNAMTSMMNPVAAAFRAWTDLQKLDTEAGSTEQAMHRVVERLESKLDRAINSLSEQPAQSQPTDVSPIGRNFQPQPTRPVRTVRQVIEERLGLLANSLEDLPQDMQQEVSDMCARGQEALRFGRRHELEQWLQRSGNLLWRIENNS